MVSPKSVAVLGAVIGAILGSLVMNAAAAAPSGDVGASAGSPPPSSPGFGIVDLVRDALANRDGGMGIGHDIASSLRERR